MKKLKIFILIFLIILLIPFSINYYVIKSNSNKIYDINDIDKNYDYVLVLGCSVLKNGEPSKMLKDRLDKAIELYENKKTEKIIVSGDHNNDYSEVDTMYDYLTNNNIPSDTIIRDNKGYSTGESIMNFKEKYKNNNVIIVTQKYHLYRALFISKKLNLNAVGISAKNINYYGQSLREIREILARNKDFMLYTFLKNQ